MRARYLLATARPIAEDLSSTIVFYLLFVMTGSALVGASVGLVIGGWQCLRHRRRGEPVPGLLLMGIALTIVLGGVSVLTHDPRFLLIKPSILYAVLSATMLPRGWVVRYVPDIARDLLPARTFDWIGWGWAALMFATATANLLLVALLPLREAASAFLIIATGGKLLLFAGQYTVLRRRAARIHAQRKAVAVADA